MAFNFNWSPLMADAGFYTRAQDLLTAALNKSPKPPIIVDDIIVTELNLGSMPPNLEILEIGDLAEDRFRGIFKMSYSGDAFLTLKTRVQANPLNTYLLTRPSFASPKPLAAATPLTIPLQITLSDFKLSGFVILVFSKQKGITVVFRNDPLESLKVSSTFDSIPFVRDFLQKEIEAQLRILFMDELPAIIHRLSLRLWVPEYRAGGDIKTQNDNTESTAEGPGQDPLASPPQDPVDAMGNALNESQIASLSLDSSVETHSLFSQKNLLRLAALTDSQRTLSLFTPSIQEVVYRAWTSPVDPSEAAASIASPLSPTLSRTHSQIGSMASSIHETASVTSSHSRPSLSSAHSFSSYGLNLGTGRHSKAHSRRRKKRVVDLRRPKTTDDAMSVSDDSAMTESSSPPSIYSAPLPVVNEQSDDPVTPPLSPETDSHLPIIPERYRTSVSRPTLRRSTLTRDNEDPSYSVETIRPSKVEDVEATPRATVRGGYQNEKAEAGPSSATARPPLPATILPFTKEDNPTGDSVDSLLVERLAGEIARRMREEKLMANNACSNFWSRAQDDAPPPAYGH
ncbi:Mitochondrial distribution and morphology protein 34-2 [Penicillium subrubescens]|uniref:Mitochondrial distribution and morphology protein 34-2 n=1 Tax=Penicillium subrubescens TaxID=1316194 RepID=UPI0025459C1D|nr:Mitochondrial distribution and morphology protein 34-2 [Penicillium subrubescens]KAJ5911216.1 Mitochondrial distribution and morphology protein 34-2 [Penicillium subrubescens]